MRFIIVLLVALLVCSRALAFLSNNARKARSPRVQCLMTQNDDIRPLTTQSREKERYSDIARNTAFFFSSSVLFPRVANARLDFDQKEYEARPSKQDAQVQQNGNPADYKAVRKDIAELISNRIEKGPTLVRLAWHSSGTYDKMKKDGGSQKGTIRFIEELKHGANAGLDLAIAWLEPTYKKFNKATDLSYADLYTLAGVVAIKELGGPNIKWRSGREDSYDASDVTPDGRLPDADKGNPMKTAEGLRTVFNRMGFNDQEIVALSGAHALGRCHASASGYAGPWSFTPTVFNNQYFVLLKGLKWIPAVNVCSFYPLLASLCTIFSSR